MQSELADSKCYLSSPGKDPKNTSKLCQVLVANTRKATQILGHTIQNETEWERYVNYIHYNPVKHGFAGCPHAWSYSGFHRFVGVGLCAGDWVGMWM